MREVLHEGGGEAVACRLRTLDRWGQLLVVAAEDDAVGLENGHPAGGLEGLRGLVDEEGREMAVLHDVVGAAYKGAADDASLQEEVVVDAYLELGLTVAEGVEAVALAAAAALLESLPF